MRKIKKLNFVLGLILISVIFFSGKICDFGKSVKQDSVQDYVPNGETAIKVAQAIWEPIYGKGIYNYEPFKAKLINDSIWVVEGYLSKDLIGGVPYIEIRKKDCKILKVTHGK